MSVISHSALESSPLADLHEIASELAMDGYRRLRKADLIAAIIERQGANGDEPADVDAIVDLVADAESPAEAGAEAEVDERPARRSRRGGRGRSRARDRDPGDIEVGEDDADTDAAPAAPAAPRGGRERGDRGGRGRDRDRAGDRDSAPAEDRLVTGTVELLPNGSGFVRVSPPEPSDDDVYVSAAQVRRCELVSGDEVAGPVRPPRRSERYPSLIRVDTINGRAADEVAEGTKYDDLVCTWATERIALDDEDATLKAIEWLTPFGRGSRVVIVGAARAGKTEALRRLAGALARQEDLECSLVLAGVRPEEFGDWKAGPLQPSVELGLGATPDAHGQAIERAIETGRRVAARGGHAVVLIDTLEHLPAPLARRTLAAARNIADGGSLTIVATASEPAGGETTVIALDATLTAAGRIPALDLGASATIRADLLVGEKGAEAIAEARSVAIGS
ncbi:MAG TPA: Rho termination factor N-terminal domain-containing protein [Solirubrobacteraceae bacterium]|nr:Rho termination factor N-terminal domain-containing protein [Solirubrobacteraceae bacterium]